MIVSVACGLTGLMAGALIVQVATAPAADGSSGALQWLAVLLPTITALGAAIIGIINALKINVNTTKTESVKAKTEEIATKTDVLAEKQGEIVVQTKKMEEQGNNRWTKLEKKYDDAIEETVQLKALVAQLLPGARDEGVRSADAKVLAAKHVSDEKSGLVGTGLSEQAKKDVKTQADQAIVDAGLQNPAKPFSPGSAGPDIPPKGNG